MKDRLKSLLALLLAAVMALSLAACGKSEDGSGDKDSQDESDPEFAYVAEYTELAKNQENYLNPRAYTEDGFYSTSYEKIGENIPEGVTPEYEGQYDVYGSFLYFVSFDGKIEKLENYKPMDPPANEEGLRDYNSSSDVSNIVVSPEGKLAAIESLYVSWSEAPEDISQSSDEYWQYYKYEQSYYIRWLENDGSEISSAKIQVDPESYLETYRMQMDEQGNLVCVSDSSKLIAIAPDGSIAYSIEVENYVDSLVKLADGRLAVGMYSTGDSIPGVSTRAAAVSISSGSGLELTIIDSENKKFSDEKYAVNANLYDAIPGNNGYDLFYTSGTNFYGLKLESGEPEKLFNWLSCDVNNNDLSSINARSDGSVVGIIMDYDSGSSSYNYELVTVRQVPYESVPKKEIITLGCIGLQYQTQDLIVDFNRSNDKYRIEVIDYSEYNNEENGYDAGLTKLNTEIMAGNVPDILDIGNLNYVQLASKGIIEDLYPYLEADGELSKDDYFENVLGAMEVDGKLCCTVPGFYIQTVMGASAVVGDTPGWTYEQFNEALASMPEGCEPFDQYVTRDLILQNCLALELENFVNWGTGECKFDSQEFVDLLNFAARFPETFDWENYDYSTAESTQERIAQGKQMLVQASVYMIEDLFYNQYTESFGGDVTFIGYPTSSGTGNMLGIDGGGYAMSSKSQYKDEVWKFLRTFMTKEYQEENVWGLSSRKDIFEEKAETAMTIQYQQDADGNFILDDEGEKIPIPRYGRYNEETGENEEVYAIDKEQIDQLRELISSTDRKANYDNDIFQIVAEESAAFFQGQKTAEDVAKLIQSKANIFVNEQR